MIEFNVGVSLEKSYEVKRIDNDYFEENQYISLKDSEVKSLRFD